MTWADVVSALLLGGAMVVLAGALGWRAGFALMMRRRPLSSRRACWFGAALGAALAAPWAFGAFVLPVVAS